MKKLICILVVAFAATATIEAQTTYKLGLDEVFEKGLENSLAIRMSQEKIHIAEDKHTLAKKNNCLILH
ncbi:MAG: hypothetical protein ACLVKO_12660 [Dysgonomonas sp.]